MYSFYAHAPELPCRRDPAAEGRVSAVLEAYYESPVVLFSSCAGALAFYLRHRGFTVRTHRLQLPDFPAACVIGAVGETAFPVDRRSAADAVLFYPQYGHPQAPLPPPGRFDLVLGDYAHCFFSPGPAPFVRALSFPKFFPVGFGGALVLTDPAEEKEVRERLAREPETPPELEAQMQRAHFDYYRRPEPDPELKRRLKIAWAIKQQFVRPLQTTLAGLPQEPAELRKVQERRRRIYETLREALVCPTARSYLAATRDPPFLVPGRFDPDRRALEDLSSRLRAAGFPAPVIYHVDVKRNQFDPDYRTALMLPCHQDLREEQLRSAGEILRSA